MGDLSKNFSRIEFKCKCGACDMKAVDAELITVLQDVRDEFGVLHITSGNRCKAHNKRIGGAKKSRHTMSLAVDFMAIDASPKEVGKYLNKKYPDKYGVGIYSRWVHLDVDDVGIRRW